MLTLDLMMMKMNDILLEILKGLCIFILFSHLAVCRRLVKESWRLGIGGVLGWQL